MNATLDLFTEQQKKRSGMDLAAGNNAEILRKFQEIALELGVNAVNPEITIDHVRRVAELRGIDYQPGAWTGSTFKGSRWECVDHRPSTHKGSHGRIVKVWKLRD